MSESVSKSENHFTHTAWILKTEMIRKGRRVGRWIDEGVARVEPEGEVSWVYLHSLPIGGFDGRICLTKIGTSPSDEISAPQRPGEDPDEATGEDVS